MLLTHTQEHTMTCWPLRLRTERSKFASRVKLEIVTKLRNRCETKHSFVFSFLKKCCPWIFSRCVSCIRTTFWRNLFVFTGTDWDWSSLAPQSLLFLHSLLFLLLFWIFVLLLFFFLFFSFSFPFSLIFPPPLLLLVFLLFYSPSLLPPTSLSSSAIAVFSPSLFLSYFSSFSPFFSFTFYSFFLLLGTFSSVILTLRSPLLPSPIPHPLILPFLIFSPL